MDESSARPSCTPVTGHIRAQELFASAKRTTAETGVARCDAETVSWRIAEYMAIDNATLPRLGIVATSFGAATILLLAACGTSDRNEPSHRTEIRLELDRAKVRGGESVGLRVLAPRQKAAFYDLFSRLDRNVGVAGSLSTS